MASRLKAAALCCIFFSGIGCATCSQPASRAFAAEDRFAFRNELRWRYALDHQGEMRTEKAEPAPPYQLHCFPMVRAAREFFYHARFDPSLPKLADYRTLVKRVVRRDSRCPSSEAAKIVIPGYANLHDFSRDHESLLKNTIGTHLSSYTQRGHWRMVFPFSKRHQASVAHQLEHELNRARLPIVHLVDFPRLRINHALLLLDARPEPGGILFTGYDPNNSHRFATLRFNSASREFLFEPNNYFPGGPVNVYEVYRNALF